MTNDDPLRPAQVSALLTRLMGDHHMPGAQLVIRRGRQTIAAATGHEEQGADRPMTDRSKIPAGSITKAFTATVAMMLVADGDLELDEPIDEYLTDLRAGRDRFGRLTPRQLLSHTSGLPSSLDEYLPPAATTSARRYLAECARQRLDPVCPPGTAFSYSNVGYVLVGHLIEVITGLPWHEAVESILLRPLGIEPAFLVTGPVDVPICPGHAVHPATGRAKPVDQTITPGTAAVGALALSASDLAAFAAPHLPSGPRSLDQEIIELMRQPVPGADPFGLADGWGLGLAVFDHDWIGHDGTGDGTSCHLRINPVEDCVVAFTSNANTGNLVWQELVAELRAAGLPVGDYRPPVALDRPQPPPAECFGQYVNGDNEYSIARWDGRPCVAVAGEIFPELAVHDRGVFSVRDPMTGQRINGGRLLADPRTGRINGLQTGGRIARRMEPVA